MNWGVISSFLLAGLLMLVPLPWVSEGLRPEWVTLVLLYWMFFSNKRIGLTTSWCIGLFVDVLQSGVLGQYALVMLLTAYGARAIRARFRLFPFWQQLATLLLFLVLGNSLLMSIQWLIDRPLQSLSYGLSIVLSLLAWPVIYNVLRSYERHV